MKNIMIRTSGACVLTALVIWCSAAGTPAVLAEDEVRGVRGGDPTDCYHDDVKMCELPGPARCNKTQ